MNNKQQSRRKQLLDLLTNRLQILELMNLYHDEFEEKDGKRGLMERVDDILDEINEIKRELNNLEN